MAGKEEFLSKKYEKWNNFEVRTLLYAVVPGLSRALAGFVGALESDKRPASSHRVSSISARVCTFLDLE